MLKLNTYRVLMKDTFNGKSFNFAIFVKAVGLFATERAVMEEFPEAEIMQIRNA